MAAKDLKLEVADGEFMILVGPSGPGKSTALRMVAELEDITGGELKIGGQVVNEKAPWDRDISMVLRNNALHPHMIVRENMGFALIKGVEYSRKLGEFKAFGATERDCPLCPPRCPGRQVLLRVVRSAVERSRCSDSSDLCALAVMPR